MGCKNISIYFIIIVIITVVARNEVMCVYHGYDMYILVFYVLIMQFDDFCDKDVLQQQRQLPATSEFRCFPGIFLPLKRLRGDDCACRMNEVVAKELGRRLYCIRS